MQMLPYQGRAPGYVDDWATVAAYLRQFGFLEKEKSSWVLFDSVFPTLEECRKEVYRTKESEEKIKTMLISRCVANVLGEDGHVSNEV